MDIYIPSKPVYYVYMYLREDNTPYYVGKGKDKRAYRKSKQDKTKTPKDKSRIIIIHDNLTELQSLILERYYIRWFGRKDNNTGILRNLTDGGEGISGLVKTQDHKNKIGKSNSISQKGNTNGSGNKGKTVPDDTRKRISETMKSIGLTPPSQKGIKRSDETKHKLRMAALLREENKRISRYSHSVQ